MKKTTTESTVIPFENAGCIQDELTLLLREGARRMLQAAIESEVAEYIERHKDEKDEQGYRMVVRNGHHPERKIQTGIGSLPVKKPKVNDKRVKDGERMRINSEILPAYLKRTKTVEELIPWLYLRGISTGDFPQALEALLGKNAQGLSATSVVRLKRHWENDYEEWLKRSLKGKRYVYIWADESA